MCLRSSAASVILCTLAGCSCPIGEVFLASRSAIKSSVAVTRLPHDLGDTGSIVDVDTSKIALNKSIHVDPELLKKVAPPACEFKGVAKPPTGSGHPGAEADPNLLKIAQLQLVSECYRSAERAVRKRFEQLRRARLRRASVDPELVKKIPPPACTFESAAAVPPHRGQPGAEADPNLLKIAQLQLVSECYRTAEHAVRKRLEQLQGALLARPNS